MRPRQVRYRKSELLRIHRVESRREEKWGCLSSSYAHNIFLLQTICSLKYKHVLHPINRHSFQEPAIDGPSYSDLPSQNPTNRLPSDLDSINLILSPLCSQPLAFVLCWGFEIGAFPNTINKKDVYPWVCASCYCMTTAAVYVHVSRTTDDLLQFFEGLNN